MSDKDNTKQPQVKKTPMRRATDNKPQKYMLTIKDVAKLLLQRSRISDEQFELILTRGEAQAARLNSHIPKNQIKQGIYLPDVASPAQVITALKSLRHKKNLRKMLLQN